MKSTDAFVGVDLAIAKKKYLPVCICVWRAGRLVPQPLRRLPLRPPRGSGNAAVLDGATTRSFVREAAAYIDEACRLLDLNPRRIAIDAPSGPRQPGVSRRAAEAAMDRAGVSVFTTPSETEFERILRKVRIHLDGGGPENRIPHANQLWMLVGFRLFEELENLAPCIEVFPQITARVLGAGETHKFRPGGVHDQLRAAAAHTGWPSSTPGEVRFQEIAFGPAHDRLDAYLAAWVAALQEGQRLPFGDPPHDVIWAPRVSTGTFQPPRLPPESQPSPSSPRSEPLAASDESRTCPACQTYRFKRWPWGWDSHAAHRCTGLAAVNPEERKAEFRAKFLG